MALTSSESEYSSLRAGTPALRLILFAVLSIALMVLDHQGEQLRGVRKALAAAAWPLHLIITAPSRSANWAAETLRTRDRLVDQNAQLRRLALSQSARLQRLESLEAENTRLRALLESTAQVGDRVLIGEIMSVDMDPYRHRLLVNRGGRDGIFVGQAVIDSEGIVGQVTRDQYFTAEVIMITDPDHALPVQILRTQQRTIALGTGDLDRLSLPFLPRAADVRPGDMIVTSGLGGTFPSGYPVGEVTDSSVAPGAEFVEVHARPSAQLDRVREVLFIWSSEDPDDGGADSSAGQPVE